MSAIDDWRWPIVIFGVIAWAGFGLPALITPFLAPSPWELPLIGVTITAFVTGLTAGALWSAA